MKKKIITICIIGSIIGLTGCTTSTNSNMTKLDKKFDSYAHKAAKTQAEQEVADYTWTTVELGEPEYAYTLYNETSNNYKVTYYAKFDEADEAADQWLELTVLLTGENKLVDNVSVSYMDARTYEAVKKYSPSGTESNGIWYNINLTNEQKEKVLNSFND